MRLALVADSEAHPRVGVRLAHRTASGTGGVTRSACCQFLDIIVGDKTFDYRSKSIMNWKENLLGSDAEIKELLQNTKTIAVVGIKIEPHQPAHYVPKYMQNAGFQIVPVPVYYPEATEILGEKVYRSLTDIPFEIDLVNIFRRSSDVPKHLADILAKKPKAVWMQSGIYNAEVAETLTQNGIKVVQDACLMVEHRSLR